MDWFFIRTISRYMVMLNFACVFYGDKYSNQLQTMVLCKNLYNMVQRNLTIPHRFICFTDNTIYINEKSLKYKYRI